MDVVINSSLRIDLRLGLIIPYCYFHYTLNRNKSFYMNNGYFSFYEKFEFLQIFTLQGP